MQPDPPPGFSPYGQPPRAGGLPLAARPRARANGVAAVVAGVLALLTAGLFVCFALYNVVHASGPDGVWSSVAVVNVVGGVLGAALLAVPAGFTFARRIAGAWTLCALCSLYVVAVFVTAPLLWGTPLSTQLRFVLGFEKSNGAVVGLAVLCGAMTAVSAAVAGSVRSPGKAAATPPGR
ncbi:hypothetical protein AB0M43_07045 [Longispora sp. NPDC051575]|uniref:hypothetical protein n=1 Tax=Longispora sp. NPDC051575 TaxID=3154943 RepID=UPI00343755B3